MQFAFEHQGSLTARGVQMALRPAVCCGHLSDPRQRHSTSTAVLTFPTERKFRSSETFSRPRFSISPLNFFLKILKKIWLR
jgi:hypothetical protein